MTETAAGTDEFIAAFVAAIGTGMPRFADKRPDLSPLTQALAGPSTATGAPASGGLEALAFMDTALAAARSQSPSVRRLAEALAALAPGLPWYRRPEPELDGFMRGHANAYVVGPRGIETRPGAEIGVTLMAPGVAYPTHHHPPREMYVALSEGEWFQAGLGWRRPGPGGLVYNPADVTHAMRAGSAPLLAVWGLWH